VAGGPTSVLARGAGVVRIGSAARPRAATGVIVADGSVGPPGRTIVWARRTAPTVTSDQLTCVVSGRPADDHAHRPADDLADYRPV
jgi:hypothetical protein